MWRNPQIWHVHVWKQNYNCVCKCVLLCRWRLDLRIFLWDITVGSSMQQRCVFSNIIISLLMIMIQQQSACHSLAMQVQLSSMLPAHWLVETFALWWCQNEMLMLSLYVTCCWITYCTVHTFWCVNMMLFQCWWLHQVMTVQHFCGRFKTINWCPQPISFFLHFLTISRSRLPNLLLFRLEI